MQIREISIRNFRGITELSWRPSDSFACLIGRGDSCKSTVLDAIEATLSPRHFPFSDLDFLNGDVANQIEITITVGELSDDAEQERRFGLHLRGWAPDGTLHDEPQTEDEPVVTVRLTVDGSLEGEWAVITDRHEPRQLHPKDRTLFGVVRLGGEVERHLTWGRGTALSALTDERSAATPLLADAFRNARTLIATNQLPELDVVAASVSAAARQLGAYCAQNYAAGLDTQRAAMNLGGISLHDGGVPVRLAGLGSRRLAALATQRLSVPSGAIVLIDEIEHGLEPHRIRHALKVLRDALTADPNAKTPLGQVLLTTHSPTTVVELKCSQLHVCHREATRVEMRVPQGETLQRIIRRVPEAFLSRRILVCEGPTEVGLVRGLRGLWTQKRSVPFEALGTWLADGGGSDAPTTALSLAKLGYVAAVFRDSDVPLSPQVITDLGIAGVPILEWTGNLSTEQRLFRDLSATGLQEVLTLACDELTEDSVRQQVASVLKIKNLATAAFADWPGTSGKTEAELRDALGTAAKRTSKDPTNRQDRGWFKNMGLGELVGNVVGREIQQDATTPLAITLSSVETWLYG